MPFLAFSKQAEKLLDTSKYQDISTTEYAGRVRAMYFDADRAPAVSTTMALTRAPKGWRFLEGFIVVDALAGSTQDLAVGISDSQGNNRHLNYFGGTTLTAEAGTHRLVGGPGALQLIEEEDRFVTLNALESAANRRVQGVLYFVHD